MIMVGAVWGVKAWNQDYRTFDGLMKGPKAPFSMKYFTLRRVPGLVRFYRYRRACNAGRFPACLGKPVRVTKALGGIGKRDGIANKATTT